MKEELEHDDGYAPLCSDTKRCCDIFKEALQDGDHARVEKLLRTKYNQSKQVKAVLQLTQQSTRRSVFIPSYNVESIHHGIILHVTSSC
ncbi:hypothetical protein LRAMOSA05208 [Lichtheimia ramosa]|uniref:Uncharacterized protein n=1 Tax=Lichtheimia ramosa TaxID=688394 RepID=A0A077X0N8_9FUNG|nr:hypothetical protein LRAMOSA05208 [Lichtheimia ramosa]